MIDIDEVFLDISIYLYEAFGGFDTTTTATTSPHRKVWIFPVDSPLGFRGETLVLGQRGIRR